MISSDPFITNLLKKIPSAQRDSFSDDQLLALKTALESAQGVRSWGAHRVDWRWTLRLWRWHYYFVFLCGVNQRDLTRREEELARSAKAALLLSFILFSTLTGLLVLYLIKSAMGIDLFSGFSLGIWGWFKEQFL